MQLISLSKEVDKGENIMDNYTSANHHIHKLEPHEIQTRVVGENEGYMVLNLGHQATLFIFNPQIVTDIAEALIYANKEFRSIKQDESKDNHGTTPQS